MKLKLPSLSLLVLVTFMPAHAAVPKPRELVREALEAQGGEQKLRDLKSVQWEASGYRNELEQSERPEGPYIVQMNEISEVHDLTPWTDLDKALTAARSHDTPDGVL